MTSRAVALSLVFAAVSFDPPAANAALFTVGPNGAFASPQAAVDAALSQNGPHEIRLQTGAYGGVSFGAVGQSLAVTGGWNAAFTARSADAKLTVLDGNDLAPVLRVNVTSPGTSLSIGGLTLTGGFSSDPLVGGGAHLINVNGVVVLENLRIVGNRSADDGGTQSGPGGVSLRAIGAGHITLRDSTIADNVVSSVASGTDRRCFAGGLFASADGGRIDIRNSAIRDNDVDGRCDTAEGGAAWLSASGGKLVFEDNLVRGNHTRAPFGIVLVGSAFDGPNHLEIRRNRLLRNRSDAAGLDLRHVALHAGAGARVDFTDNLVAASPTVQLGIQAGNVAGGTLRLTNNTITGHRNFGVSACNNGGAVSFSNGIVTRNGTDLVTCSGAPATVKLIANFVGGDAKFRDPEQLDFRLKPNSSAINSGSNNPPGGLGPLDLAGSARKKGPKVDRGAYEAQ